MTLYVFTNPRSAVVGYLKSKTWPTGTTVSTSFPSTAITAPHLQVGWDGTPSEDRSREVGAIRCTVWGVKGQETATADLASLVRARLLDYADAAIWRVTPGAGRTPGVDPDTGLPFVTFTVNAETRPAAV